MAEKTLAQLREELAAAEWKEYLAAKKAKQEERIALLSGKVKAKAAAVDGAKKKLAEINAEIKSGKIGIVPRPIAGGVSVTPATAVLGVEGT